MRSVSRVIMRFFRSTLKSPKRSVSTGLATCGKRRLSASARARNSPCRTGLTMQSSAPALSAATMSYSLLCSETRKIGTGAHRCSRAHHKTSVPSMPPASGAQVPTISRWYVSRAESLTNRLPDSYTSVVCPAERNQPHTISASCAFSSTSAILMSPSLCRNNLVRKITHSPAFLTPCRGLFTNLLRLLTTLTLDGRMLISFDAPTPPFAQRIRPKQQTR